MNQTLSLPFYVVTTPEGTEVTHARLREKGNPREVGDTRLDATMLNLWGQSLTSSFSSSDGNY